MDLANWAYGLLRNSPQGLNISSIRVFDLIRDQEIPITLRLSRELKFLQVMYESFDCDLKEGIFYSSFQ